ncbi:MAG: zinc ABC transporter substrate-binding protein [Venatoribacter sp.]
MKRLGFLCLTLTLLYGQSALAALPEKAIQVLASVHPIALMAASVVPTEQLHTLVPVGMTPHDFSLRPSDIDTIQNADIIIWAGKDSEPYLAGFTQRWSDKIWIDISSYGKGSEVKDPHWWFATDIMIQAQDRLAAELGVVHSDFASRVRAATQYAYSELTPLQKQGFFVFHQAYDHWVKAMDLHQVGAFTISPERKPGARTLQTMRKQLSQGEVVCVFSEPEFSPALVDATVAGIEINRGELDPMATHIALAEDGYIKFIEDLTQRFKRCLTQ